MSWVLAPILWSLLAYADALNTTLSREPSFGTPPSQRYGYVAALVGNSLLVFGGSGNSVDNDFYAFDLVDNTWSQILSAGGVLPPGRRYGSGAFLNNQFYVFGGQDSTAALLNDLWVYDFNSAVWTLIAPATVVKPTQRYYTCMFIMSGDTTGLYVYGGASVTGRMSDFWRFDLSTLQWAQIPVPGFDVQARGGQVVPQTATSLLVFSGNDSSSATTAGPLNVYLVALDTGSWSLVSSADGPLSRYVFGVTEVQGVVYVGWGYNDLIQNDYTDVWSFDIANSTWTQVDWPVSSSGSTVGVRDSYTWFTYNDSIICFGGWGVIYLNNVFNYNVATGDIEELVPVLFTPVARADHCGIVIGNSMLVFGGAVEGSPTNDLYTYSLDTFEWSSTPASGTLPPQRKGHACVAVGVRLIVFGGLSAEGVLNDMWSYNVVSSIWEEIKGVGDVPLNRADHAMTPLTEDILLMYGGSDGVEALPDAYIFDVLAAEWTKLALHDYSYPGATTPSAVISVSLVPFPKSQAPNDGLLRAVAVGGMNANGSPLGDVSILIIDPVALTLKYEWTDNALFIPARSDHKAVLIGEQIVVGPGSVYDLQTSDLLVVQIDGGHNGTYFRLDTPPLSLIDYSLVAYGDRLLFYGGYSTLPGQQATILTVASNDIWELRTNDICGTVFMDSNCVQCQGGTIAVPSGGCVACAQGSYSYNGTCTPCPLGFYGSVTGSISPLECLPCLIGSFANVTGLARCHPCPAGLQCPLGSAFPTAVAASGDVVQNSQPTDTITDQSARALDAQIFIACAFGGAVGFVSLLALLFRKMLPLYKVDYVYALNHTVREGHSPRLKRTNMGGFFAIIFVLATLWLILTNIITPAFNNLVATRSFIPVTLIESLQITADFKFVVTLYSYQDTCAVTGTSTCVSDIAVTYDSSTLTPKGHSPTTTCAGNTAAQTCTVSWVCDDCLPGNNPTVTFVWAGPNTFASYFDWYANATAAMPARSSVVWGTVRPAAGTTFRGLSLYSNVTLDATGVVYKVLANQTTATGFLFDYSATQKGSAQTSPTFYDTTGVGVQIQLNTANVILEVTVAEQLTWIIVLSAILGSISAVLAGAGFAMRMVETIHIEMKDRRWFGMTPKRQVDSFGRTISDEEAASVTRSSERYSDKRKRWRRSSSSSSGSSSEGKSRSTSGRNPAYSSGSAKSTSNKSPTGKSGSGIPTTGSSNPAKSDDGEAVAAAAAAAASNSERVTGGGDARAPATLDSVTRRRGGEYSKSGSGAQPASENPNAEVAPQNKREAPAPGDQGGSASGSD